MDFKAKRKPSLYQSQHKLISAVPEGLQDLLDNALTFQSIQSDLKSNINIQDIKKEQETAFEEASGTVSLSSNVSIEFLLANCGSNNSCGLCFDEFSTKLALKAHLCDHFENTCDLFNTTFDKALQKNAVKTSSSSSNPSIKTETTSCNFMHQDLSNEVEIGQKGTFQCSFCIFSTTVQECLDSHMIVHANEKISTNNLCVPRVEEDNYDSVNLYQCLVCEFSTKFQHELNKHVEGHSAESNNELDNTNAQVSDFKCIVCSKTFENREMLDTHIKDHEVNMNYECLFCGFCAKRKSILLCHIKKSHYKKKILRQVTKKDIICLIELFGTKLSLEESDDDDGGDNCTLASSEFIDCEGGDEAEQDDSSVTPFLVCDKNTSASELDNFKFFTVIKDNQICTLLDDKANDATEEAETTFKPINFVDVSVSNDNEPPVDLLDNENALSNDNYGENIVWSSSDDENQFYCDKCNYYTNSQSKLQNHINNKHRKKYQCPVCHRMLFSVACFISHSKTHLKKSSSSPPPKQEIFQCRICLKEFPNKAGLRTHSKSHHTETNPSLSNLSRIQRLLDLNSKILKDGQINSVSKLRSNASIVNSDSIVIDGSDEEGTVKKQLSSPLLLGNLSLQVSSATLSKTHLEKSSPAPSKPENFICNICTKQFITKAGLLSHLRSHEIEFNCSSPKNLTLKLLLDSNNKVLKDDRMDHNYKPRIKTSSVVNLNPIVIDSSNGKGSTIKQPSNLLSLRNLLFQVPGVSLLKTHPTKSGLAPLPPLKPGRLICSICSKQFLTKAGLLSHTRSHNNICSPSNNILTHQGLLDSNNKVLNGEQTDPNYKPRINASSAVNSDPIVIDSSDDEGNTVKQPSSSMPLGNLLLQVPGATLLVNVLPPGAKPNSSNLNQQPFVIAKPVPVTKSSANTPDVATVIDITDDDDNNTTNVQIIQKNTTKNFTCTVCNTSFVDVNSLQDHTKSHKESSVHINIQDILQSHLGQKVTVLGGNTENSCNSKNVPIAKATQIAEYLSDKSKSINIKSFTQQLNEVSNSTNKIENADTTANKTLTLKLPPSCSSNVLGNIKHYSCADCEKVFVDEPSLNSHKCACNGKLASQNTKTTPNQNIQSEKTFMCDVCKSWCPCNIFENHMKNHFMDFLIKSKTDSELQKIIENELCINVSSATEIKTDVTLNNKNSINTSNVYDNDAESRKLEVEDTNNETVKVYDKNHKRVDCNESAKQDKNLDINIVAIQTEDNKNLINVKLNSDLEELRSEDDPNCKDTANIDSESEKLVSNTVINIEINKVQSEDDNQKSIDAINCELKTPEKTGNANRNIETVKEDDKNASIECESAKQEAKNAVIDAETIEKPVVNTGAIMEAVESAIEDDKNHKIADSKLEKQVQSADVNMETVGSVTEDANDHTIANGTLKKQVQNTNANMQIIESVTDDNKSHVVDSNLEKQVENTDVNVATLERTEDNHKIADSKIEKQLGNTNASMQSIESVMEGDKNYKIPEEKQLENIANKETIENITVDDNNYKIAGSGLEKQVINTDINMQTIESLTENEKSHKIVGVKEVQVENTDMQSIKIDDENSLNHKNVDGVETESGTPEKQVEPTNNAAIEFRKFLNTIMSFMNSEATEKQKTLDLFKVEPKTRTATKVKQKKFNKTQDPDVQLITTVKDAEVITVSDEDDDTCQYKTSNEKMGIKAKVYVLPDSNISHVASSQPYKCDNCTFSSAHLASLAAHRRRMHTFFPCPICHKQYLYIYTLQTHMDTYHRQCPFRSCQYCSFYTTDLNSYNEHIKNHGKGTCGLQNVLDQEVPNVKESIPESLSIHPVKGRNNTCNTTVTVNSSDTELQTNKIDDEINKTSLVAEPSEFPCSKCEYIFATQKGLSVHDRLVHGREIERFCKVCNATFVSVRSLKLHMENHSNHLKCAHCDFKTRSRNKMKTHLLSHRTQDSKQSKLPEVHLPVSKVDTTKENQTEQSNTTFTCNKCPFSTSTNRSLLIHIKKVHCNEKHTCATCKSKFPTVGALRIHMKVHFFNCIVCKYFTKDKSKLDKHMDNFHLNKTRAISVGLRSSINNQKADIASIEELIAPNIIYKSMSDAIPRITKNKRYKTRSSVNKQVVEKRQTRSATKSNEKNKANELRNKNGRKNVKVLPMSDIIVPNTSKTNACDEKTILLNKNSVVKNVDLEETISKDTTACITEDSGFEQLLILDSIENLIVPSKILKPKNTRKTKRRSTNIQQTPILKKPKLDSTLNVSENTVKKHSIIMHSCKYCSFSTKSKRVLKLHSFLHTGKFSRVCTECKYKTDRKVNVTKHSKVHTGLYNFACNVCNYTSLFKYKLRLHIATHIGDRPHACKLCSYHASSKRSLYFHLYGHLILRKKYKCNFCNYRSKQKRSLLLHSKTSRCHVDK